MATMPNIGSAELRKHKEPNAILLAAFTRFPNGLFDAALRAAPVSDFKVLGFFVRELVGFNRLRSFISLSRVVQGTGLCRDRVIASIAFWVRVGVLKRVGYHGLRGTAEFEIDPELDSEALTSRIRRLVAISDQSETKTRTSRERPTPLVDFGDPIKESSIESERRGEARRSTSRPLADVIDPWVELGFQVPVGDEYFRWRFEYRFEFLFWSLQGRPRERRNEFSFVEFCECFIAGCEHAKIRVPEEFRTAVQGPPLLRTGVGELQA